MKKANRQCEECQLGPNSPFGIDIKRRIVEGNKSGQYPSHCHWAEKTDDSLQTCASAMTYEKTPVCFQGAKILERNNHGPLEAVPVHSYKSLLHMCVPGSIIYIDVAHREFANGKLISETKGRTISHVVCKEEIHP